MMQLHEITRLLNIEHNYQDKLINHISTDSRNLQKDDVFVALIGETFDGHDFVAMAAQKKAAAVLVERPIQCDIPTLMVANTRIALGKIAAHHRHKFAIPFLAVTGSCGKTTTKTMLANILMQVGDTLAPESSFNNDVGVPLTLLKLQNTHRFAVLELGANHLGEIKYLCELVKPNVSVITNVAPAHLEGFGSIEGVAKAKGEIYQGLQQDGTAIINADDQFAAYWLDMLTDKKIVSFGLTKGDFTAQNVAVSAEGKPTFLLVTPSGEIPIQLPVLGVHNVSNALAAAACAMEVGATAKAIQQGLNSFVPVGKRLIKYKGYNGTVIIDDTYNANPLSVIAALETLAQMSAPEKIFVFGDMAELGEQGEELHKQIGERARTLGIQKLFTYGTLSHITAKTFGENAYHFEDQMELVAALQKILTPGAAVLVKGSRAFRMEKVVQALI